MKTIAILIALVLTAIPGCGGGDGSRSDADAAESAKLDSGVQAVTDTATSGAPELAHSTADTSAFDTVVPLDTSVQLVLDGAAPDTSDFDDASVDAAADRDGAGPMATDGNTDPASSSSAPDAAQSICNTASLAPVPPLRLSDTGCFTPGVPGQPIADFMPYEVNSPLWSDGAAKQRYLKIPEGQTIGVKDCDRAPGACLPVARGGSPEDEGHFDLPVGSILIKVFSLQGRRIETRLLMRASDAVWSTYSYQWNEAETEAILGRDGGDRAIDGQVWHYPSEGECTQCHTLAAGRSLGLSTQQIDRRTAVGNQVDLLLARGWLVGRPKALSPLPDPGLPGPAGGRARSYLQANCSFCHRPGSNTSDMDMRYTTALLEMNVCNVPIQRGAGHAGVPQFRVVPGKPSESALSFRMHDRVAGYNMPRIGSNLVDPTGTAVVDQWIAELTGCSTAAAP